MKKIIISMVLVVLLATASSATITIIYSSLVSDGRVKIVILCIDGYQYIHTKYSNTKYSWVGSHTMIQSFEEKEGRSVPIKCIHKNDSKF